MGTRKQKGKDKRSGPRKVVQRNREPVLEDPWTSALLNKDLTCLRKVAAEQGITTKQSRIQSWPLLLGGDSSYPATKGYEEWSKASHRDSSTVRCDVDRSLHTFLKGAATKKLFERRVELHQLLNAAVNHQEGIFYYQGLHDVASVLLLVLGEAAAFPVLCRLTTGHLRDCTRQSMDAVLELLQLLHPLLESADPELASHVRRLDLAPYYALPWVLTWFAHDVTSLAQACRLFDLFLASHPLMPLYVGVAAMRCWRAQLLSCHGMAEMHSALMNGWRTWPLDVEELVHKALSLYNKMGPERLLGRVPPMQLAVTPAARVENGHWIVPDEPPPPPRRVPGGGLVSSFTLLRMARRVAGGRGGAVLVLSVGGASLLAVLAHTYMNQMPNRFWM